MAKGCKKNDLQNLPACAEEYIKQVLKKMRYRRKVRRDVQAELAAHFEDELKDYATDDEKEQKAKQLIAEFGDVKLLAILLRRAKKRCRPLWRKALVRSFQALGIIIIYFLICFVPLHVGRPTISFNYVDWLNDIVQGGRDEAENARPYYEKAVTLYVEMPQWLIKSKAIWPTDFNDVQLSFLSTWLEDNKQAIEALRQGSRCPGFWSKYQCDETELSKAPLASISIISAIVDNLMENLTCYKSLARALRWQILYEAYKGNVETAFSDCVALMRFGGHLYGHGLWIEQLAGISIELLANSTFFVLLEWVDVPADVLKRAQEELDKQFGRQEPVISLEAEKVFWYDAIQRTFTDDGQGGGRMLLLGLVYVATDDWMENLWRFVSFSYPDRQEMVAKIDRYFERFAEIPAETPYDLRNETIDEDVWNEVNIIPLMLKISTPAYGSINRIAWRMKTGRQALLTVLAIMRYEKEKGRYPASLVELVEAGYLKELPRDPFSDKPLVYKKADDNFILYSVGPNFTDDGGEPGKDKRGQARQWRDNSDTVFWPMQESYVRL
jgi:general secretion pathway protein G